MSEDTKLKQGKELLSEAYTWKVRSEKAKSKFDELKRDLATFFKTHRDIPELTLEDDTYSSGSVITAKLSERVSSLNYNVDALRASLGKERANEVIQRTYTIIDIDKMIVLLKDAGVSPDEFKKLIQIDEVADKAAIQQLFSVGDITAEQLKGTYSATISQSVSITNKKKRG